MKIHSYSSVQMLSLVALRLAIGWHFLYEGLSKLYQPGWSAQAYLMDSAGWFAGFFQWLAAGETWLGIIDTLNIAALILIGLFLMLGLAGRYATISAILLLTLFYLSHPAIPGIEYAAPAEGNYFLIDKNLIEILALVVLGMFPTSHLIGIDRFLSKKQSVPAKSLQTA
jgi:thiosulfate dehydrogenase [quinone] large subunit